MSKDIHPKRHETRADTVRPAPLSFQGGSRFNIPEEVKSADPDYVYGLINDFSLGDTMSDDAQSMGWHVVRRGENAILDQAYTTRVTSKDKDDSLLRFKGQIVAKMHKQDWEALQAKSAEDLAAQMDAVQVYRDKTQEIAPDLVGNLLQTAAANGAPNIASF